MNIEENTVFFNKINPIFQLISEKCFQDFLAFRKLLDTLNPSKQTHYYKLNETFDVVYDFLHIKLKEYNFINGNKEENQKNKDALFFFNIYSNVECFINSKYYLELKEPCSVHHASAFARIYTLKKEIDFLIEKYSKN